MSSTLPRVMATLLAFATGPVVAGKREIVVFKPDPCPGCEIYEQLADVRDYVRGVVDPTSDERVDVRVLPKSELPPAWHRQIERLPYIDAAARRSLFEEPSLLVVYRDGRTIRSAGNIADSANLWQARYPDAVMQPAVQGPYPDLVLHPKGYYRDYFVGNWRLEYFLELAQDEGRRTPATLLEAIAPTAFPPVLARRNLLLWGSADTPRANARFISERMIEIEQRLSDIAKGLNVVRLFGHGAAPGNDSAYESNGEIHFRRAALPPHLAADAQTLVDLFAALVPGQRNLLVQVGHSGPYGAPLWGSLKPMSPDDFGSLTRLGNAENVMVSGACHGGQFARGVQCGFFAARPDVIASGCQRSEAAVAGSDDYLRWFFASLGREHRALADRNGDGRITFAEAHWFASLRVEHHELPYTSLDALAERYLESHPEALPAHFTASDFDSLRSFGDADEQAVLEELLQGLRPGTSLPLRDLAQQKRALDEMLEGMREASSEQRNDKLSAPYRLLLAQLARRLIWLSKEKNGEELRRVRSCEDLGIGEFLD